MNIAVDIRSLLHPHRTGVGEYTYGLLSAVFSLDTPHEFFLFYNSGRDVSAHLPPWNGAHIHYVGSRFPNKLLNGSIRLLRRPALDARIARRSGLPSIDCFFSPNLHFTALSPRTKHILTIHDLSFEHLPDCYSRKRQWWHRAVRPRAQCEQAALIVTPSRYTREDIIDTYGIPEEKVRVLPPGLSPAFYATHGRPDEEVRRKYALPQTYILFVGTVEPRKNIIAAIDAFQTIRRATGASLVIAGAEGWKDAHIRQRIEEAPDVRAVGYVSPEDKPALYRMARLFVYPSLYEGFGFPVLEAMASGAPVITSNRTSLPEVGGDAAWYVDPYNIAEIASAMRRLLDDASLRAQYRERGLKQAKQFSWHTAARQFLSCVDEQTLR